MRLSTDSTIVASGHHLKFNEFVPEYCKLCIWKMRTVNLPLFELEVQNYDWESHVDYRIIHYELAKSLRAFNVTNCTVQQNQGG